MPFVAANLGKRAVVRALSRRTIPRDGLTLKDFASGAGSESSSSDPQIPVHEHPLLRPHTGEDAPQHHHPSVSQLTVAERRVVKVGPNNDGSPAPGSLMAAPGSLEGSSFYIETYGCQMNINDTAVVSSILERSGMRRTESLQLADLALVNTCSVRDNAEQRVWGRLGDLRAEKVRREREISRANGRGESKKRRERVPGADHRGEETPEDAERQGRAAAPRGPLLVGLLGCMARRLREKVLERESLVDVIAGPDAYRSLPDLVAIARETGDAAVNVQLSADETYADIRPVRDAAGPRSGLSAFVTIMRGCSQRCTFCQVPNSTGPEKSRPMHTVLEEVRRLSGEGYKEITLLGQNVNAYADTSPESLADSERAAFTSPAQGFRTRIKMPEVGVSFTELIDRVSRIDPELRVRAMSPHPAQYGADLIQLMAERDNICNSVHAPAQSGSTTVLERMERGYSRDAYDALIADLRAAIPDIAISSDFISGFCGETEEDHRDTVSLLREVAFDQAFMFAYSTRERTRANRRYTDDVPEKVKLRRLREVIDTFQDGLQRRSQFWAGTTQIVLVEGKSRRSDARWTGLTDGMRRVVFDDVPVFESVADAARAGGATAPRPATIARGDYVAVRIRDVQASHKTMDADAIAITSISEFGRVVRRREAGLGPLPWA